MALLVASLLAILETLDQRLELLCRPCDGRFSVALGRLPEQAQGRIPGAVVATELPAPVRNVSQENPSRPPQRARQMGNRRIGRDDQIQALHYRRTIDEGIALIVEFVAQRLYTHAGRQSGQLIQALV